MTQATTGTGKYEQMLVRCQGLNPVPTAVAHPCEETALAGAMLMLVLWAPWRPASPPGVTRRTITTSGLAALTINDTAPSGDRYNLFIVAIAVGFGMIPLVAPAFFAKLPKELEPLLNSGIVLAALAAVLLNAYFNGAGSREETEAELAKAAGASDHA